MLISYYFVVFEIAFLSSLKRGKRFGFVVLYYAMAFTITILISEFSTVNIF